MITLFMTHTTGHCRYSNLATMLATSSSWESSMIGIMLEFLTQCETTQSRSIPSRTSWSPSAHHKKSTPAQNYKQTCGTWTVSTPLVSPSPTTARRLQPTRLSSSHAVCRTCYSSLTTCLNFSTWSAKTHGLWLNGTMLIIDEKRLAKNWTSIFYFIR